MYIDSHVHFRDFKQKHKETVKHGLEVARDSGVDAVFDMPNTDPPIMTRELVLERLQLARDANIPEVFYGIYMGLTGDADQLRKAVAIYREFPQVIGMKLYAGHSVGDLGVINIEDQASVYETLTDEEYDGVLVIHAEKECEMNPKTWNPRKPISHCHARPEKAEIESVRDQIKLARQYEFPGKLHIAHISSPKAVELVIDARKNGLDISSGICPHHFIYDWQQMVSDNGVLWKMNPPLRKPESRLKMLEYLKDGTIDWIETDHAPHSLIEKTQNPYMSGIQGLPWWSLFEEFLRQNDFSDTRIYEVTFENVARRFAKDITRSTRKTVFRGDDYSFNPYKPMEKELGFR